MCWNSVLSDFNSRLFPKNPSGSSKEWLLGRRGLMGALAGVRG